MRGLSVPICKFTSSSNTVLYEIIRNPLFFESCYVIFMIQPYSLRSSFLASNIQDRRIIYVCSPSSHASSFAMAGYGDFLPARQQSVGQNDFKSFEPFRSLGWGNPGVGWTDGRTDGQREVASVDPTTTSKQKVFSLNIQAALLQSHASVASAGKMYI